jgi:hypothetical protein
MVSWVLAAARTQSECAHPHNFAHVAYSSRSVWLNQPVLHFKGQTQFDEISRPRKATAGVPFDAV